MRSLISVGENIRPILASIRTVPVPAKLLPDAPAPTIPFITVSRQPGAGAWSFAQEFVQAMNHADPYGPPWTCWDRELVEKVAADHQLSTQLIDSLQKSTHSWLNDLLEGFSGETHPDETMVYHRVASTIVALAQAGRVVLVGRGAPFVTRRLAGGIHLRFAAPLEHRIHSIEETMHLTHKKAAQWIATEEKRRAAFYKHFWPGESLGPENFTLAINTARVGGEELIEMVRALVRCRERALSPAHSHA